MSESVQIQKPAIRSRSAAKRAAAESGAVAIHMSKFMKCKEIGEAMQSLDVLKIGLGMFAFSKDTLEQAIGKFTGMMMVTDNPETAVAVGNLLKQLVSGYNETANSIIKSTPSEETRKRDRQVVFPPNSVVTATVKVDGTQQPKQAQANDIEV